MEPGDLTIRVLQEIRKEIYDTHAQVESFTGEQRKFNDEQRKFNDEQRKFNDEQREFNRAALGRFSVLETTLRELSEQMVMMARAIKMSLEHRSSVVARLDDHEHRLIDLEAKRRD